MHSCQLVVHSAHVVLLLLRQNRAFGESVPLVAIAVVGVDPVIEQPHGGARQRVAVAAAAAAAGAAFAAESFFGFAFFSSAPDVDA